MVQLLESTKSYFKNSTKLGRRMSHYKDEMSSSETSLPPEKAHATVPAKQCSSTEKSPSRTSQRRLSGLFSLTRSNSNSSSTRHSIPSPTEDHPSSGLLSRKIGPDTEASGDEKRRNSKSSDRTHATSSDKSSHSNSDMRRRSQRVSIAVDGSNGVRTAENDLHAVQEQQPHHHQQHQRGSQILDCDRRRASRAHSQYDDVPRGRSPTWSMSNTISTATSSYHTRPSDYPSMKHYQAHVWRRQLLEDSIMHSLKLGYADRNRTVTRQRSRSRSLKGNARTRKVKEQAMLAAALGKDLPEPSSSVAGHQETGQRHHSHEDDTITEEVTSRSMDVLKPLPKIKNSPYMTQTNASMLNITQSFASFTLELNENDVHRVMSSSVIPDLFRIKAHLGPGNSPRPRRNSKAGKGSNTHSSIPSHSVPGKEGRPDMSLEAPTADWASSVFVSLDKHQDGTASAPNGTGLPESPSGNTGVKEAHSAVHVAAATAV
ncbi:hypothetical protein BGZ73_005909 [Actinomortierella ambigua]|nr:hypothetical protein BGZ73_005909 [Actinomortierella ambigua]